MNYVNVCIAFLQKMLPIPPSEILKTWADISTSREFLGFNPTVNLTEGTSSLQYRFYNL